MWRGRERGLPSLLPSIWAPRKTHNWLRSPQPHPASVAFLPFLSPRWVAPQPRFYTSLPTRGETGARPAWGSWQAHVRGPHPRPKAAGNHRGAQGAGHPCRGLHQLRWEQRTWAPGSPPQAERPEGSPSSYPTCSSLAADDPHTPGGSTAPCTHAPPTPIHAGLSRP